MIISCYFICFHHHCARCVISAFVSATSWTCTSCLLENPVGPLVVSNFFDSASPQGKGIEKKPTSANQLYIFGGTLYEETFNISICAMIRTWYLCHDECTLKRRVTIHFSGKVTNDKQCFDHGTYDSMARIVFGCEHFGG